jgi:hypothetical protein
VKSQAERWPKVEINVTVSAIQFTALTDISNEVWQMKHFLDQRINSALPSTMFTNGTLDSTIVLKQNVLSAREQRTKEKRRKNAVRGIKRLMRIDGVNVSGMTKKDWDYLLDMTNLDVPRKYHARRKDLDKSVQKTFTDIKAQLKKQSSSKNLDNLYYKHYLIY